MLLMIPCRLGGCHPEKAMENIVNNDLLRPTQTVRVHGTKVKNPKTKMIMGRLLFLYTKS
jgi:hypothetical protein